MLRLSRVACRTGSVRWTRCPFRASSMAVGEPAQRAPTTMASWRRKYECPQRVTIRLAIRVGTRRLGRSDLCCADRDEAVRQHESDDGHAQGSHQTVEVRAAGLSVFHQETTSSDRRAHGEPWNSSQVTPSTTMSYRNLVPPLRRGRPVKGKIEAGRHVLLFVGASFGIVRGAADAGNGSPRRTTPPRSSSRGTPRRAGSRNQTPVRPLCHASLHWKVQRNRGSAEGDPPRAGYRQDEPFSDAGAGRNVVPCGVPYQSFVTGLRGAALR
jgi:hypothetical protein